MPRADTSQKTPRNAIRWQARPSQQPSSTQGWHATSNLHSVQRHDDALDRIVQLLRLQVTIHLRNRDAAVAEQLLHLVQRHAILNQSRCKRVAEAVEVELGVHTLRVHSSV